ncbi:TrmH family RNA methyltransferase [Geitlerinema sp. P-1104]|uniref:TrmH family RNA methyltransferase n=1 Tax=Geitlerinema sp. P-1104 TaxID=2546230 RepID=UPI0014774103|nr:RNA methyltransferase [Geitlerinema sp. P-1104]NMG60227.1 TrmH family RNA methyltransferase [Geitlerinema sp. P-1104]
MNLQTQKDLIAYLTQHMTEARAARMDEVLGKRTRQLAVVLEGIHKPHNASAVLRSCDGFGVQDVHIIERDTEFDPNQQVSLGADRWLSLHRYDDYGVNNTAICFDRLKDQGFTLLATTPHEPTVNIDEVPIEGKTAILFGSELRGLSTYALSHADVRVKIPMYGFSESFNISVSAALCLYELTKRLRQGNHSWRLTEAERIALKLEWLRRSLRAYDQLEAEFIASLETPSSSPLG